VRSGGSRGVSGLVAAIGRLVAAVGRLVAAIAGLVPARLVAAVAGLVAAIGRLVAAVGRVASLSGHVVTARLVVGVASAIIATVGRTIRGIRSPRLVRAIGRVIAAGGLVARAAVAVRLSISTVARIGTASRLLLELIVPLAVLRVDHKHHTHLAMIALGAVEVLGISGIDLPRLGPGLLLSRLGTNPESKPAPLLHGEPQLDSVTVWFLERNSNSIVSPSEAVTNDGV